MEPKQTEPTKKIVIKVKEATQELPGEPVKKKRKSPKIDRRKSRKGIGGRPTKKDEGTVAKLEICFQTDYNVTQACLVAGIDTKTYYRWLANDDAFRHKMEAAKQYATMLAKDGHIQLLKLKDGPAIRFQLQKKAVDPETGQAEYKETSAVEATVEVKVDLSKQAEEAAKPFIQNEGDA